MSLDDIKTKCAASLAPDADTGETARRADPLPPLNPGQPVKDKADAGFKTSRLARGLGGDQIDSDNGPIMKVGGGGKPPGKAGDGGGGGGGGGGTPGFHKRAGPDQFVQQLNKGVCVVRRNLAFVMVLTFATNMVALWGRDTASSLTSQVRAQDRNIIWAAVSRGARLLTQIAMLGWGAYLAIQGEITGGMVIAASIIAGRALAPIEGAIEGWNGFILSRSAFDRIKALMHNSVQRFEKLRLPNPEGRLNVERLLYVPGGTKQVILNGLTFSLNPGDSLAIIGNSGAGKTTLGKMLVGSILPTSGNVRLDLMDLRNWDTRQLGENIGYLPQDVQLFPGTIKANIARMRMGARDEDIHRAALLADVHDMIAMLPHGYETQVAADGSPLSGGQKQRIALARAFFGNPRFLVLDEPNSNLDAAGDQALANAIRHAGENGITVVVITQKPSLLSVVDKIMLLADGNLALFGHRAQVLEQLALRKTGGGGNLPGRAQPQG
ncbi:hypothetical protein DC366_07530 [Pelagivirga sediminicola]|uniref:Type I secretion system permease/ATPase n=1 Tax=Pelagivirga sediminicola TaxID=2170575 RepID=A0A2T7G8H5_9RHOB|nr:ATP-binding cassette domain-containing protein [Pelagivirga sediminicola]PVA10720.1 hypothetical protein DC366_07530 [Pelagivirga sediminicola]